MAADRESENRSYPENDLSEFSDLLERLTSETPRSSRRESEPARPRRQASAQDEDRPRRRQTPAQDEDRPRRRQTPAQDEDRPQRRRQTPPQEGTARAGQHAAAGRHNAGEPAPARQRRSAAGTPDPERTPPAQRSGHRRPISRKRLHRRLVTLAALVLVIGTVFIVANITVARVKGFTVASATENQQVLSWEKSRGADGYGIYDGNGTLLTELSADADTQYVASGLQGGTQYTYTIVAMKNFLGKHSSKAVACSAYTLPEAVGTLKALNSGTGVLLNWEDGGASGYEVQYTDAAGTPKTVEAKSGGDGLSIPDLQEGLQYTFQIRRYVQDGESRIYSNWTAAAPITAVHTADMTGVDITKPMVALTFDDGPDYVDYTETILDTLKEYGGHASFFQCGTSSSELPEKIKRIIAEGNEIACHTYDHSHYGTDVTVDDIVRADDLIEQACGQRPSAFRSPGGMTTDLIREVCVSENMPIFYWSIDTEDWKSRDADAVCDAVMGHVSDGDIILMHNVYSSTVEAVKRIVPYLVENGYQLVTVSQLVLAKTGSPPVPGVQYITATETN